MADFAKFKHGGVQFPLPSALTNSLLQDADPALYRLLEYYAGVLQIHMGARLIAEATAAGLSWSNAVLDRVSIDPAPYLQEANLRFPLLALYRQSETNEDRTMAWRKDDAELGLVYVLGPLRIEQAMRLTPALRAAGRILEHATEQGYDPAYNSGAKVMELAGLEQIEVYRGVYGSYEAADGNTYPAYTATIRLRERSNTPDGDLQAFEGADVALDEATDSPEVTDLVTFQTDVTVPDPG